MGNVFTAGPYEHNPWVGDRPMKYPYTFSAKVAQFPFVYHWRYCLLGRSSVAAFALGLPFFYWIQRLSYSPANVEEWFGKDGIRAKWYTPKHPPEYDLY